MSKLVKRLLRPEMKAIFDIDGTMMAYEIGDRNHAAAKNDADWQQYIIEKRPYDRGIPIEPVRRFIKQKGPENCFVISCADSNVFHKNNEADQKKRFVMREYGIPEEHVFFVSYPEQKIGVLKDIARMACIPESQIGYVDDRVKTLNEIMREMDCMTVHISSFFGF